MGEKWLGFRNVLVLLVVAFAVTGLPEGAEAKVLASASTVVTITIPETSAQVETDCHEIVLKRMHPGNGHPPKQYNGYRYGPPCDLSITKEQGGRTILLFNHQRFWRKFSKPGEPKNHLPLGLSFAVVPKHHPLPHRHSSAWMSSKEFHQYRLELTQRGTHRFTLYTRLKKRILPQDSELVIRWDVTQANR